jgi:hypothetical protein
MPQFAGAFGQRRKHRVAMGNGFIARQVQSAGQEFRWLNGLFFHSRILAREVCLSRKLPPQLKSGAFLLYFLNLIYLLYFLYSRPVFRGHVLYRVLKSRPRVARIMS